MKPKFKLLRELAAIVDGVPDEQFDLSSLATIPDRKKPMCGTIACAMGWFALHPLGKGLGLSILDLGYRSALAIDGEWTGSWVPAYAKLGLNKEEGDELFDWDFGEDWEGNRETGTEPDKREFRRRIIALFEKYNQPINPEYRV